MGWKTRIEELRAAISRHPKRALSEIEAALETADRPSDRANLLGLKSACHRHLGEFKESHDTVSIALRHRCQRLIKAELFGHLATLRIAQHSWTEALNAVEEGFNALPEPSTASSRWGRDQRKQRNNVLAGLLKLQAQAHFHNLEPKRALEIARQALPLATSRQTRLAVLTELALILTRSGRARDLEDIARALRRIRIPQRDRLTRAQVDACLAIIAARFGSLEQAERLLTGSLETFRSLNAPQLYHQALELLIWIIRDRTAKPGRARLMAQKLRALAPESPPI